MLSSFINAAVCSQPGFAQAGICGCHHLHAQVAFFVAPEEAASVPAGATRSPAAGRAADAGFARSGLVCDVMKNHERELDLRDAASFDFDRAPARRASPLCWRTAWRT
jgi:hypothetical protein